MLNLFLAIIAFIGSVIINLVRNSLSLLTNLYKTLLFTARKFTYPVVLKKSRRKALKNNPIYIRAFGIGFGACFIFIFIPFTIYSWFLQLPSPKALSHSTPPLPTQLLDAKGRLLYEIYQDKKSEPVTLNSVPADFKHALIAVEDADFYKHHGVDIKGIVRATYQSLAKKNLQGGSTITQQLVKNVLLSPERTVSRKIKEIVLSVLAENFYTKDQILEMYINNVSFGGVAIGAQAASEKYFGKNIADLDLAESSMLAGLPGAPTSYSPILDLTSAKQRQRYVLDRMVEQKYISKERADEEYNKTLHFYDQSIYIRAPHFVAYVIDQIKQKYGTRILQMGGLKIYTTLDLDVQEKVSEAVASELSKNGSKLYITNGAAIVLDVENSSVLAYQGSVDYFKDSWGSYDVIQAFRQPGSSIKPVTYSLALANGYTAASVLNDSPVRFSTKGSPAYTPVNYDGRYHGAVSLRQALANSYNIPAVKLAAALGPDKVLEQGKRLGLNSWNNKTDYGLSITLGGEEVTMYDLANVYATFARNGIKKDLHTVDKIEQYDGHLLYSFRKEEGQQVLSPEVSYILSHILSDNLARLPAFGFNNSLAIPGYTVAVKTGTTNNKRDNWTFGYTPSFVVGVWVGNNNNTAMNPNLASGLSGAAPIWNSITNYVLKNTAYNSKDFNMPDGIFVLVDKNCGGKSEVFIKSEKYPSTLCSHDNKNNSELGKKTAVL